MDPTYASLNRVLDELEDAKCLEDPAEVLFAFAQWAQAGGRPLYPHQEHAITEIAQGNHAIVATPTGTGKSLIGIGAHALALATGRRSIYTAPLKALVSEKFFDLVHVFGAQNVGMITGDVSLNADAPIICATAEILANQSLRDGAQTEFELVVVDEFHYYADPQRGWAWQVPLLELPNAQFVLMSATLGNVQFFVDYLKSWSGRDCAVIDEAERPVPLEFDYQVESVEKIVELTLKEGRYPVYVVHFAQADAVSRAKALAAASIVDKNTCKRAAEAIRGEYFGKGFGQTLRDLLKRGVGVHHAGMLPRYRRLVERLAQSGALAIICGTDTLGVGINVPIRCVLFTQLTKFDGVRERQLSAREFHQIAGRAGRAGFDTVGFVKVAAPEHEVVNSRIAAANEGKLKKKKKIKPQAGTVSWTKATFERLCVAAPETLQPQFEISHSTVLNVIAGQRLARRDAAEHLLWLAFNNHAALRLRGCNAPDSERNAWARSLGQVYDSLLRAKVIKRFASHTAPFDPLATKVTNVDDDFVPQIDVVNELPEDFALNQALSPFALAALELLDPESPTFALDVISIIESVLEGPRQLLFAQRSEERGHAIAALKASGMEYEQRQEIVEKISWPQPLVELLQPAFQTYRQANPWLLDREIQPKSVVRFMVEHAMTFSELIARYDLGRSEGVILRYLSDAFRALRQIVPETHRTEVVEEVIAWLGETIRAVDSSLLDEWEALESGNFDDAKHSASGSDERAFGADEDGYVAWSANRYMFTTAIRDYLFQIVEAIAADSIDRLEKLQLPGWDANRWDNVLEQLWDEYEWIGIGNEARAADMFSLSPNPSPFEMEFLGELDEGTWTATQILDDSEADYDWRIIAAIDVEASDRAHRNEWLSARQEQREPRRVRPIISKIFVGSTAGIN